MTERKWTPGPWEKTSESGEIASREGVYIARAIGTVTEEGKANAHLIAAAPDLYEALEWAEDELASYAPDPSCRSKITDDILVRVRTALDKARGEQ